MARLNLDRDCVVVRIVYDGTARSGKTTTLRALGASLGREVETPAETEGRTLYFDWLDYTGGRFDGRAIRCQVVTVPGQAALERRRRTLLKEADAVVFVMDTSAAGYPSSLEALRRAVAELERRQPPVGLVVQANQRDRDDAVAVATIRSDCAALSSNLAVNESSATSGLGVRETFVFSVRLALDRVRELQQSGGLPAGRPEVDDPSELFAELLREEAAAEPEPWEGGVGGEDSPAPWVRSRSAVRSAAEDAPAGQQGAPWPPDGSVPSGLIWPPVAGRFMLREAAALPLEPARHADGSWTNEEGAAWRLHSDLEAIYFDLDEGRSALVEWARHHATVANLLSRRSIVLARAAPGAWRLWQLVAAVASLEEGLRRSWNEGTPESIAETLLEAARRSLDFQARLAGTPLAKRGTLANLAVEGGQTVFSGLFPAKIDRAEEGGETASAGEILRLHFAPLLQEFAAPAAWDRNLRVVVEIRRQAAVRGWAGIGEILCRLLPAA